MKIIQINNACRLFCGPPTGSQNLVREGLGSSRVGERGEDYSSRYLLHLARISLAFFQLAMAETMTSYCSRAIATAKYETV